MICLEELTLYLPVFRMDSPITDGNQLYDQFLYSMKELKKFTFYIETMVANSDDSILLPPNEDIQRSLIGRNDQQIASYVRPKLGPYRIGECVIYSLPYAFEYFFGLDNSFRGGQFHRVRTLKMSDRSSSPRQLFRLISQDFPFLQSLSVGNRCPQEVEEDALALITFPYLTSLDLEWAHIHYAEQFLLNKSMCLPRLVNLCIEWESLVTMAQNFTNDPKLFNFSQVKSLQLLQPFVRCENFHQYFPLL
jgi:hypothetical protein